jgi:hypothetical protein
MSKRKLYEVAQQQSASRDIRIYKVSKTGAIERAVSINQPCGRTTKEEILEPVKQWNPYH